LSDPDHAAHNSQSAEDREAIANRVTLIPFGLAPLQTVDPASLITGDDDLDGFVLSLALAYNDVKTIHWIQYLLLKHPPADLLEISPDAGQWHGMRVQANRWLMALAHEIILSISRASAMGVLRKKSIRTVVKSLPAAYQELWMELVAVSTKPSGRGAALRPYLRDLRNEGVFHYKYPAKLLEGYKAFFLGGARVSHNEHAYVSMGPSLKETRFYFADAAAQRMYTGNQTLETRFKQAEAFSGDLHHTLAGFVWGYLKRL
jgi:hypothetical protein